jgi:transposase
MVGERYFNTREVAEMFGVSPATVLNWYRWKLIDGLEVFKNPDSKRPGKIIFSESAVEKARLSGKI